jgi:hypothetical protein
LTADKVYLNSIRFGIQVNFPPHCGHEKAKEVDDFVKNVFDRLAAYEDSGLSPDEVQELAKAKADGRLKILPAKPGDIIYRSEALQFCWVITKVEIYEDEIVFIDDSDNIFRLDDIGKTVFLTRAEAEEALKGGTA